MRTPQEAAEWMLSKYKNSSYSPEARAADHAFSHGLRSTPCTSSAADDGRKYWLAVLKAMESIKGVDA